jgi:hypothetical protein
MDRLLPKHRVFIEAFDGDPVEAARIAELSTTEDGLKRISKKLMKQPLIIKALEERSKYMDTTKRVIATREERQELWTKIMINEDPHLKPEYDSNNVPIKPLANIPLATRLKASELLGKSEADFVDKIDMTSKITLTDIILGSYATDSDRSLEDIEAEYKLIKNRKLTSDEEYEELEALESPELLDLDGLI